MSETSAYSFDIGQKHIYIGTHCMILCALQRDHMAHTQCSGAHTPKIQNYGNVNVSEDYRSHDRVVAQSPIWPAMAIR
jgi:hypothetical protein